MSEGFKAQWPMDLGAPEGSLEAKQPRPANIGKDVVDPARYYSREFMNAEWEYLWPKVWLLAGVTSDIRDAGDFTVFTHGHEQFLITRTHDGDIRAFYNVCPHRGNRVCLTDHGSVRQFSCPFHGWTFNLDGTLAGITDEHTYDPDLIRHRPGLGEVRCDTAGGLIFINMDGEAPPLKDWIGLPPGYIENYEIEHMNVVRHVRSEWLANWKTGVDAFYETYHLPHIHPQTQGVMEDYSQVDLYPNGFSRMIVPIGVKSHRVGDQDNLDPYQVAFLAEAGVDPDSFKGTPRDVRPAIQKAKRERGKQFGLDYYDRLTDGQLTDSWATGYFPNVQIGMHPEGVFIMRFTPHATDPERFYYDNITMFRYVDDPGFTVPAWMGLPEGTDVSGEIRPEVEHVPAGVNPELGEVLDQDVELVAAVQEGVKSRGFNGPLWCEQEDRLRHFHRELDRYLSGGA
ncbi:MAG: aromatic ring-hydroxylating dioxygenase subunit alpha [Hyphomonadaceae bacterium]|nr:aromatic ring-hydroxylating dioxygenase subunit alpha [Hyphomonadaceae bacterium]MBC6412046.1 aromatic ring-hydroxylating dioxygenase subunit alpha [Hyphomonadaceae bacterium]